MRRPPFWRYLPLLLIAALAWSPAAPATADGPPPPTLPVTLPTLAVAQPDVTLCNTGSGQPVLYDQCNTPYGSAIISQDSTNDQIDTQAADDFFVNPGANSWQIKAVEVEGQFNVATTVNLVNVAFYADAGGLPGYLLATRSVHPISGTAGTGEFFLPINPAVQIGSNASYWVSVQVVQSTAANWLWAERGAQTLAVAVWKNPSDVFSTGCRDWTALNQCFPAEGPGLLFRLYGTPSTSHVTPILLSMTPNAAIHRTFSLAAHGVGFASGATLDWSLGNKHFTTTLSSSTDLTATIQAADVPGPFNGTVSVTVTNPGPCAGSCTSNALTFTMANRNYLPLIRR